MSWLTMPTSPRSEPRVTSRMSSPSTVIRPDGHVVEAGDERGQRRLAAAGRPDQGDGACRPRCRGRCRTAPAGPARSANSTDSKRMWPGPGAKRRRVRALDDLAVDVEHLEDPLARGHRPLVLADPHAGASQRHDEQREVAVDGEERAQRQRAVDDAVAADQEHRGHGQARERRAAAARSGPGSGPPRSPGRTPAGRARRSGSLSRSSWANAFTTRTPTMFSSAWVVTSATRCWTSFRIGMADPRVAVRGRASSAARRPARSAPAASRCRAAPRRRSRP